MVDAQTVKEGDYISFNGVTGEVKIAQVASISAARGATRSSASSRTTARSSP